MIQDKGFKEKLILETKIFLASVPFANTTEIFKVIKPKFKKLSWDVFSYILSESCIPRKKGSARSVIYYLIKDKKKVSK